MCELVHEEQPDHDDSEGRHDQAATTLAQKEALLECQVVGLPKVEYDAFTPAVALAHVVVKCEGRLFLDGGLHPFGGVACVILNDGRDPVFAHAAFGAHVEAERAFYFRVDDPVAALDAEETDVEHFTDPAELELVVPHPDAVHHREPVVLGPVLFRVDDEPVGERMLLVFVFDQVVLINAEIYYIVSIFDVEI